MRRDVMADVFPYFCNVHIEAIRWFKLTDVGV
jgi:hypothetical protein